MRRLLDSFTFVQGSCFIFLFVRFAMGIEFRESSLMISAKTTAVAQKGTAYDMDILRVAYLMFVQPLEHDELHVFDYIIFYQ